MGYPRDENGRQLADKAKRPKPGIPLDKKVIAELIVSTGGNVSRVADMMGSNRGSIAQVIDATPDLQALLRQSRERQIDELEETVWDRAKKSQDTALQLFLLKTQAKHRGYDQNEAQNAAKDIATAAFDFIISKQKQSQ
jgi:hypothetical protein